MLFSSLTFIYLFLPIVLFFYFVILKKSRYWQNILLFLASLLFYAWGEPKFVFVMIACIVFNWFLGLAIDKKRENKKICKLIVFIGVFLNLSILFVFKYLSFSGAIVNRIFDLSLTVPKVRLPIGISFFTFQAMSYVIDVYRNDAKAQKNIFYVGLYISLFPQLIAGPIVRYETVADEIVNRKETRQDFFEGFSRFVIGLAKKVLLANSFAILADFAFDSLHEYATISVAYSWLGALAYSLQIFFDFSGYSDMAIGLGRMFGFHFLENFNYPYISTSVSEFWRRWHISLGTWFRDYLYIPLGGSRVSKPRNILNLFIVWSLTGLWHGANLTFVVWGLMYFVLISVEKLLGEDKKKHSGMIMAFKWIYTMIFVIFGWVIFRSDSLQDAYIYIKSMLGLSGNKLTDGMFVGFLSQNIILLFVGTIFCTPICKIIKRKVKQGFLLNVVSVFALMILLVLSISSLVGSEYNPFIYFNF